jgi:hypothetical protein
MFRNGSSAYLIYLGTVVGMGGPLWTSPPRTTCAIGRNAAELPCLLRPQEGVLARRAGVPALRIALDIRRASIRTELGNDRFYRWLNRTAM